MEVTKRLATILAGAALLIGLAAVPAQAATGQLSLFSGGCEGSRVGLKIAGSTTGSYPGGRTMRVELWGDDPSYDDFLDGPFVDAQTYPLSGTATYQMLLCILPSTLNEDWGTDEVYARVQFIRTGTSVIVESLNTNNISHSF